MTENVQGDLMNLIYYTDTYILLIQTTDPLIIATRSINPAIQTETNIIMLFPV